MTLAALGASTACTGDESAEQRVCDAGSDLRDDLGDVVTDVEEGDLGEASDGASDAGESFDELVAALDDLGEEQREALEPEIDALGSDVTALREAEDLEELGAGLDDFLTQAEVVYDGVADTVNCD